MPGKSGLATACSMRRWRSATLVSLIACTLAEVAVLAEAATATRDGLALAPGTVEGVRTGVGMGVLILRVSVAAAPGTGVGSAANRLAQPAVSSVAKAAITNRRAVRAHPSPLAALAASPSGRGRREAAGEGCARRIPLHFTRRPRATDWNPDRSGFTRTAGLAQVVAKLLGSAWMAQLSQRLGFDLTNAFAGYPELASDLFERSLTSVVEAKTQGNDAALAL